MLAPDRKPISRDGRPVASGSSRRPGSAFARILAVTIFLVCLAAVSCDSPVLSGISGEGRLTREALFDEVWMQDIESGDPARAYIKFHADGTFSYNFTQPRKFQYDNGQETWAVENGALVLSWTEGACYDVFPLASGNRMNLYGIQSVGNLAVTFTRIDRTEEAPAPSPFTAEDLADEIWLQEIRGGNSPIIYVKFHADGTFSYNFTQPRKFRYDNGQETWKIEDGALRLSWGEGGCIDTFPLRDGSRTEVWGVQSLENRVIRFTRVDHVADLVPAAFVTTDLANEVWRREGQNASPPTAYIQFRPDGTFAYSYDGPADFSYDDGEETWVIEESTLQLRWDNEDYSDVFPITGGGRTIVYGVHSQSHKAVRLERESAAP